MASSLIDVCRFNPTAGALTDWTVSSAVTGYFTPANSGAVNAAIYSYRAESNDLTQWEVGFGAYNTATGVLARTSILFSSNSNAKVNFSTVPQVAIVALAEDLLPVANIETFTAALSADVLLNNVSNYQNGPAVAQGTGAKTWEVTGSVTCTDTAGAAAFDGKLWDGTTVIASGRTSNVAANFGVVLTLSGIIASPAGNLRLDVKGASSTAGLIKFNLTGNGKDATITAKRIK